MLENNLNIRFKKFKDSIINNKYKFGKYWEKEKTTFEVDFKDGLFNSKGSRDYLPRIFDESIIDDEIVPINGKKFVQLGEKKLCTLKNSGSRHLLHLSHYFHEIKKIIKDNDICLDVGSGSGLLQFIIHQNKKTTNLYNQSDISSNQQSQITEEQNEIERNLLIKIINNDRLSEKELQEIRDTLILFYGYGRVEISNFTNYELEEELMMLNNL